MDSALLCTPTSYVSLLSVERRAAPEYLETMKRTAATDMYAVGIVLLELATLQEAYPPAVTSKYLVDGVYDSTRVNIACGYDT